MLMNAFGAKWFNTSLFIVSQTTCAKQILVKKYDGCEGQLM
jgi:hypothetical protein